ncbi:MAG: isoprenylcysteine carboxylmethyltransferase family protein [Chitinispirillaceae bacterium]|nr:isoprenylcysteine carboxylmethyltransferase family protein [Chitinispirillaceae bacterium]
MNIFSMIHLTNAWILVVPIWLIGHIIASGNRRGMKRAADMSWYTRGDRIASFAGMFFMIAFMAVSFFIRVNIPSLWFVLGAVIVLFGFLANIAAKVSFAKAEAGFTITGGIYKYSRNPMYASFSLVMLGAAVASRSFLLFALWVVTVICTHWLILGEERYCRKTYGDPYRQYMKNTPRYF